MTDKPSIMIDVFSEDETKVQLGTARFVRPLDAAIDLAEVELNLGYTVTLRLVKEGQEVEEFDHRVEGEA